jgi:hypothetical protein
MASAKDADNNNNNSNNRKRSFQFLVGGSRGPLDLRGMVPVARTLIRTCGARTFPNNRYTGCMTILKLAYGVHLVRQASLNPPFKTQ